MDGADRPDAAPAEVTRAVKGARHSHRRLLEGIAGLDDQQVRQPSLLPDWTVGHVLTHLARNADSHVRALEGARAGQIEPRYPGGMTQRASEIEAGAGRAAVELLGDVRDSIDALEVAWATLPVEAWEVVGLPPAEAAASLPFKRWREVEVHHADLRGPYTYADWPDEYVTLELRNAVMAWRARMPMGHTDLPAGALALSPATRLAWLLGRIEVERLPTVDQWL